MYIGTATAYGMQGFLVYLFPEQGHGAGTVVVATHAKFDVNYFPARKSDERVHNFFTTLSSKNDSLDSTMISSDLLDCDGLLELQVYANTEHDSGEDEPAAASAEFIGKESTAKNSTAPTADGTFPIDNRPDS